MLRHLDSQHLTKRLNLAIILTFRITSVRKSDTPCLKILLAFGENLEVLRRINKPRLELLDLLDRGKITDSCIYGKTYR